METQKRGEWKGKWKTRDSKRKDDGAEEKGTERYRNKKRRQDNSESRRGDNSKIRHSPLRFSARVYPS